MKYIQYVAVLFFGVFLFSFSAPHAFASGSCASNGVGTSWNTAADWTGTCSGAGGIPGAGDNVTITAGDPITLDVDTAALKSLTINDVLDTSSSNHALNVGGVPGTLTINSGGTLTAHASTVTVGGFFYDQAGTFNAGTSTVDFVLNGATTMIYGNVTFYNLMFAPTITGTNSYDIGGGAITVNNNFTINPTAGSSQVLNATEDGSINVVGTLSVGGSGSATSTFTTQGNTLSAGNISIGSGSTLSASSSSTINLTGTSGTLFTNSGTFTAGTSTINLSGNGSAIFNSASLTVCNVISSGTGTKGLGGTLTFNNSCNLSVTNGTFDPEGTVYGGTGSALSVTNATINIATTSFSGTYNGFSPVTLGTGSTVNYNAAGAQTIDSTQAYVNLATGGSGTKSLNGATTASGTLTIGSGTTLDTTSAHSYGLTIGTLSVGGSGAAITCNASTITVTGTGGPLINMSSSGVGINYGTSTFNFSGSGDATIVNSIQTDFYNVTISGTGTKTAGAGGMIFKNGGTLSVVVGAFDSGGNVGLGGPVTATLSVTGGTIDVENTFAGDYPFTTVSLGANSTVNYDAGGSQTVDRAQSYGNLTVSGSGTKSLNGTTNVSGTLTINAGTLDTTSGGSYTINAANMVQNAGIFIPNNSTINLTGTSGTLYSYLGGGIGTGAPTYNLTGNGSATVNSGQFNTCNLTSSGTGTKTVGAGGISMNSGCAITITNGTFDMGTYTASSTAATLSVTNATLDIGASTFAGNFSGFTTVTFGTGSTVNYDAAGTQTVYNAAPYYNLTISGGPREVDFPTTGTTTVTGAFTANGTAGNLLSLFSPSSGTQWTFVPSGTASVSYVNIKDSACGAGAISYITQTNLTNSGNNGTCWFAPVIAAVAQSTEHHGAAIPPVFPTALLGAPKLDFSIDKGASTVNSSILTLELDADPNTVAGYAVSLDPMFANGGISPYTSAVSSGTFQLPSKAGTYTVYLEYFSSTGNRSQVLSHTVSYEPDGASAISQNVGQGTFTHALARGSTGADVTALQKLLVSEGELVMPAGADFGYFGTATKIALEAFQVKYGIAAAGAPGYGLFGPKTRAEANSL